jgi:hypothetical protein
VRLFPLSTMAYQMAAARALRFIAGVFAACVATSGSAQVASNAPPRAALVIANAEYVTPADRLVGPARDADIVSKALVRAGFSVAVVRNASAQQMEAAVNTLADQLKQAGPASVGLVYYAGHGGADRAKRANFLAPVDVANVGSTDLATRGYPVEAIFKRLAYLDERPAIVVVIDACRSTSGNPATTASPLLDPPDPGRGFLVSHSTGQGQVASDSSSFAEAFSNFIGQPGLTLEQAFDAIRRDVSGRNSGQLPNHKSGLVAKVCLAGCSDLASTRGKYAGNPVLLKTIQGDVEKLTADLERLQARQRCANGYGTLIDLNNSALTALRSGDSETAGGTWELVLQRGSVISAVLTSLDRAAESIQRTEESRSTNMTRYARTEFQRLARTYDRLISALASESQKNAKQESELKAMRDLHEVAAKLAADSNYRAAADTMVDAINMGLSIEVSFKRRNNTQIEKINWEERFPPLKLPAIDPRTMFANTPCR